MKISTATGWTNTIVRPPLVPRGLAAITSRAQRAEEYERRLLEVAMGSSCQSSVEFAMPVVAANPG